MCRRWQCGWWVMYHILHGIGPSLLVMFLGLIGSSCVVVPGFRSTWFRNQKVNIGYLPVEWVIEKALDRKWDFLKCWILDIVVFTMNSSLFHQNYIIKIIWRVIPKVLMSHYVVLSLLYACIEMGTKKLMSIKLYFSILFAPGTYI